MEHDPLRDGHDGLLCLIESGQLRPDGIVGVCHLSEAGVRKSRCTNVYLVFALGSFADEVLERWMTSTCA